MPNFFKSFFSGKSETPESEKQKNDQKNFEIFKYDGLRAQTHGTSGLCHKVLYRGACHRRGFRTDGYLSQLYIPMGETEKAANFWRKWQ